jgi:ankyrin repeat protein
MSSDSEELLKAFQRATTEFKLCPNRVWAVAGEDLPNLLPSFILKHQEQESYDHELCTFDFCEYSQRDFTAVQQRHECKGAGCLPLCGSFSRRILEKAACSGKSTVWNLAGNAMLEPPRPYMAISHVWSDGTGTGAWRDGEVNECLYLYFRGIAEHFQCEGIWWDALCIPRAKAARNKAIQKILTNYQDARIALVHDCFLRNWDWDPETACFGILMSPWFSRGWTALELAKSRKVKVIFKGRYGPVIKDLDEEILAKADEINVPRIKASRIIRNLRKEFTSLNDLLTVLRPRFTSWPKDMAVISALLVGIEPEERQQKTYRSILKKLGELCPENLFHNAATMSDEFSWCPTSLFKMPLERSSEVRLKILGNDIRGKWRISRHYVESGLEKNCIWHSSHPLITRQPQDVLKCPRRCRLLTKCGTEPVQRALLVRERHGARYQYLGALYFRQELRARSTDDWIEEDVIICGIQGDDGLMRHPGQDRSARDAECTNLSNYHQDERSDHTLDVENLKHAVWRGECDYPAFSEMMGRVDLEIPDCLGRRLLHLAAERGDKRCVESLLASNVDKEARCHNGQTALYLASWGGSASVVRLLLDQYSDVTAKDNYGNTALHIAARMGFESIVRLLIEKKIPVNAEGHNNLTPLHYATMNGHKAVVKLLLKEGAKVNVKDSKIGWVPLHCAAESGDEDVAELLIKSGADVNVTDSIVGWNPLHFAAMNGHEKMMHLLIRQGANSKAKDMYGWMPQQFAVLNGHGHFGVVELSSCEGETSPFADKGRLTPIHCIAINRQRVLHKLLDGNGTDIDFSSSKENWSPMLFAVQNSL